MRKRRIIILHFISQYWGEIPYFGPVSVLNAITRQREKQIKLSHWPQLDKFY